MKMCIMRPIVNMYSSGTDYLEVSVIQHYLFQIRMRSSVNRTPFGVASLGGVLRAVWEPPLKSGDPPFDNTTATSVRAWYALNRVPITAITVTFIYVDQR